MLKKHVPAGFTPSLSHGKNVPLFNIRCLQINDPSFANKMFKISVISYTHIGATYKPFQHTNPSNTHPCTSVVLATPFFQLESLKTRLAGHLVWKALTHAKGKHTEPNQQLSSEKDRKKTPSSSCLFCSSPVLPKKRNANKQQVLKNWTRICV